MEAARAIGTGRVGNGMTMRQNSQPIFNAANQFSSTMRTPTSPPINMIANNPPAPKRSSVQDRLKINRQPNQTENSHLAINP